MVLTCLFVLLLMGLSSWSSQVGVAFVSCLWKSSTVLPLGDIWELANCVLPSFLVFGGPS